MNLSHFYIYECFLFQAHDVYTPSSSLNQAQSAEEPNVVNAFLNSGQTKSVVDNTVNVNVYNPVISRRFKQAIITYKAKTNIEAGDVITI